MTQALTHFTICETTKGSDTNACGSDNRISTTLTATLSPAQEVPVTLTFNTDAAVYTLTGNHNHSRRPDERNADDHSRQQQDHRRRQARHPNADNSQHWITKPVGASLTIKDDDILSKPTGVKVSVDGAKAQVDWTATSGATGYIVQWDDANDDWDNIPNSQTATVSGGANTNRSISSLTSGTTYYFRVIATKTGYDDSVPSDSVSATPKTGNVDYDEDNDGLIEIKTLAQLNAMRWDLDGNGVAATGGYDSNNDGDYTDTGEYTYAAKYAEALPQPRRQHGLQRIRHHHI